MVWWFTSHSLVGGGEKTKNNLLIAFKLRIVFLTSSVFSDKINHKMTMTPEADDWESLLDSGQLDANIKKMTILQRPKTGAPPSSNGEQQNIPVNIVQCSDDPMSQYRQTEPVIKIMKRPGNGVTQTTSSNNKPKVEQKSLKQREQEYAEARQRILGSVGPETNQE